jgi:hypothetical protein
MGQQIFCSHFPPQQLILFIGIGAFSTKHILGGGTEEHMLLNSLIIINSIKGNWGVESV